MIKLFKDFGCSTKLHPGSNFSSISKNHQRNFFSYLQQQSAVTAGEGVAPAPCLTTSNQAGAEAPPTSCQPRAAVDPPGCPSRHPVQWRGWLTSASSTPASQSWRSLSAVTTHMLNWRLTVVAQEESRPSGWSSGLLPPPLPLETGWAFLGCMPDGHHCSFFFFFRAAGRGSVSPLPLGAAAAPRGLQFCLRFCCLRGFSDTWCDEASQVSPVAHVEPAGLFSSFKALKVVIKSNKRFFCWGEAPPDDYLELPVVSGGALSCCCAFRGPVVAHWCSDSDLKQRLDWRPQEGFAVLCLFSQAWGFEGIMWKSKAAAGRRFSASSACDRELKEPDPNSS